MQTMPQTMTPWPMAGDFVAVGFIEFCSSDAQMWCMLHTVHLLAMEVIKHQVIKFVIY